MVELTEKQEKIINEWISIYSSGSGIIFGWKQEEFKKILKRFATFYENERGINDI